MLKPTKLLPINMAAPVVMKSSRLSPVNFGIKPKKKKHKPVVPEPAVQPAVRTTVQPPDPVVVQPMFDKTVTRFRNLLPDIEGLTGKILDGDLDHTQAIEVESKADDLVDWAPNVLVWCADKRFLGMKPYAKQAEILLHLFEDYCARCSDMSYLMDIPTSDPIEQIMAKVALLDFGVCPHCGFTRAEGRASKAFHDPLELIAVIGQRAGKCVTGDTEFFDGLRRRLVEGAVDQNFEVVSKNESNKINYCKATAFKQGEKECVRLFLKDGSAVTLSTDHRVFTARGWVPAGNLLATDLVGTPRRIPEPPKPLDVSDDEVKLAAYLLSDGNVTGTSTRFTNVTPAVVAEFIEVATRLGNGDLNRMKAKQVLDKEAVDQIRQKWSSGLYTQSALAAEYGVSQPHVSEVVNGFKGNGRLKKTGLRAQNNYTYSATGLSWFKDKWDTTGLSKEKRIPAQFWGLSDRQIALFLNRLWSCDGYVCNNHVGVTLASEKMIDDIKFLLSRLGIRASKKYRVAKTGGKTFDAWRLTAYGADALRFLDVIAPILGKEAASEACREHLASRSRNTTYDIVPIARKEISEIADELYLKTGKKVKHEIREFTSAKATGHISRDMLQRLVEAYGYEGKYSWLLDTEVIWEGVEQVEPVGKKQVYDLSVPETECFVGNNIVLHNSALTAMSISYLIHRNLHLTSPWKVYNLTPGQVIDFTVVATTVGQSEKTLWSAFKGMFSQSHWFKAYKAACDEEGKRHGVKETVKVGETFLFFDHKGILIYFAANNPSSLRGTTRFGAAIDELGWFGEAEPGSQKVRSNGPETYSALNNACLTLRTAVDNQIKKNPTTNLPIPIMFNISSPRAMNDPIMTVFRDRASDPRVIRRHWSTWEVNPNLSREALSRELATSNGVRDFAAQPPVTDDPLVPKPHIVTDCFKNPLATDARYGPLIVPSAVGHVDDLEVPSGRLTASYITAGLQEQNTVKLPSYGYLKDLEHSDPEAWEGLGPLQTVFKDLISRPASGRAHIMGVDLGTKNNALAVVCGYLSTDNSKFITDFALEVKPSVIRSVNVADVFDKLMVPLVERLNVVAVFYDTWQSVHQIQSLSQKFGSLGPLNSPAERRRWLKELRDKNQRPAFVADQYSLTMTDAMMLVSRMEQGDCLFPALEVSIMELLVNRSIDPVAYPYAQLALQISTVRARGARLLKPVGGDDDLFRAWANAAIKALTDEMVVDLLSQETRGQPMQQKNNLKRSGYVSMASSGKGLRRTETLQPGTLSNSNSTNGMPLSVKRGVLGGLRGNQNG
jgi:intein/homing endonuclease